MTMPEMWVYVLVILLSASQVRPLREERDEVGTCRYDQTSVAVFTCIQPDGNWRPPSATCCNALLLYAVDHLPAGAESGACCLCRYMRAKDVPPGLVTSYVICQGKDSNAVTRWSSVPMISCSIACGRRNDSSDAKKDPPIAQGAAGSSISNILWAVASVAICVTLLVCCWYLWWVKRAAIAHPPSGRGSSSPESDRNRISSSGRRTSAQLRNEGCHLPDLLPTVK